MNYKTIEAEAIRQRADQMNIIPYIPQYAGVLYQTISAIPHGQRQHIVQQYQQLTVPDDSRWLISISSYHPFEKGGEPNALFRSTLEAGVDFWKDNQNSTILLHGSAHRPNIRPLEEAGKAFVSNEVPADKIVLSSTLNTAGKFGTYNTYDEVQNTLELSNKLNAPIAHVVASSHWMTLFMHYRNSNRLPERILIAGENNELSALIDIGRSVFVQLVKDWSPTSFMGKLSRSLRSQQSV